MTLLTVYVTLRLFALDSRPLCTVHRPLPSVTQENVTPELSPALQLPLIVALAMGDSPASWMVITTRALQRPPPMLLLLLSRSPTWILLLGTGQAPGGRPGCSSAPMSLAAPFGRPSLSKSSQGAATPACDAVPSSITSEPAGTW